MKALIASGGRGTRLRPITHTRNKHLIPIANKPILHYAIEAAAEAGITSVGIVINADSDEVPHAIGDGSRWGIRITYIPQLTPGGLAQVVALAEPFIGKDKFIFYLGDNMVVGGVRRFIDEFEKSDSNCFLTLARVRDRNASESRRSATGASWRSKKNRNIRRARLRWRASTCTITTSSKQ